MAKDLGGIYWTVDIRTQELLDGTNKIKRSTDQATKSLEGVEHASQNTERSMISLSRVAKALAGALAFRQLQNYVVNTARAIDEQNNFAQAIGITYENLQRLQYVAAQNGATQGELNNSLRRLTRRAEEAANGTGSAVNAFRMLGIEAKDLAGLSPDEIFLRVSDSFRNLSSTGEQARVAFGLFDVEGAKLINTLRLGRTEIERTGNSLDNVVSAKAAKAAAEFNNELVKLRQVSGAAGGQIAEQLLPALSSVVSGFTSIVNDGETVNNAITYIGYAAQASAVILGGRFVSAMASSTAETVKRTQASIREARQTVAATAATLEKSKAEVAHMRVVQQSLVAQLNQARTEQQKTAIRMQLRVHTDALTVANARLTAAQNANTAAMQRANLVGRAWAGTLALMGGPAGAIMLVVGALGMLAWNLSRSTRDIDDHKNSIVLLADSYRSLNEQQLRSGIEEHQNRLNAIEEERNSLLERQAKLREKLADAEKKNIDDITENVLSSGMLLAGTEASKTSVIDTSDIRRELSELETSLEPFNEIFNDATQHINAMENALDAMGDSASNNAAKGSEEFEKLRDSLVNAQREIQHSLGDTSNEFEEFIALQRLGADATQEQRNEISALVAGLQLLRKEQELQKTVEGNLGLTRLQSLRQQYETEREMLLEAQRFGIESEISYQERLSELYRQYSEERKQIIADETDTWKKRLEEVGFSFDSLMNQGVGSLASVAVGFQDGQSAARMFAQTVLTQGIGALIRLAIQSVIGQRTVEASTVASAGVIAGAMAGPAALTSLATSGANAAPAQAGIAATMGVANGLKFGGGRRYGGPVNAGQMYEVGESNLPELYMQGSRQYLIPGNRGHVTSNKDMPQGNTNNVNMNMNFTINGDANEDTIEAIRNALFDSEDDLVDALERALNRQGRKLP